MQVFMNNEIPSIEEILDSLKTVPSLDEARDIIEECNWVNLGHWTMKAIPATEEEYGHYEVTVQYIEGESGKQVEKMVVLPFNIKE
jgi:hypothetical protein